MESVYQSHPLAEGFAPTWAYGWGEDRFGPWVEIAVEEVRQCLRWIPPGQFLMGSPEEEEGRSKNEGPRHEVELTEGFWLFDTPCTQAFWEAVMGTNPSKFKSPKRPVERVSWEDAQEFIGKINGIIPDLDLSLPGEAQWEYACRAGTDSAIYTGGLEILGGNNAPALDGIAWYGGNSGVDFDLENGYDSSRWGEKQYPHSKAGTREVGLKAANPWGLYDMLGNVYEWCLDGGRTYGKERVTDPLGPMDAGALRVVRGGSWGSLARYVRAAYRYWNVPGYRFNNLGFRCARVQEGGA